MSLIEYSDMNSWEYFLKFQGNRGSNKELDLVSFIEYSDMNSWEIGSSVLN